MTRILCLSDLWLPFPGGAERLIFNIARDLMRRGLDVHVVTGYEAAQQFDGPSVTHLSIPTGPDREEGAAVVTDLIRAGTPDVVLTHHHWAHEFGVDLVASTVPVVQVVLNGGRIPGAALAVYISEWVRGRAGGTSPADMVITPPAFPDVVADTHADAIGFIKPIPHKGVDLIYQIAAAMPARRFVVLRGEWQTLEMIRPAPNIEFVEPVDDIRDFYGRCRLMLVPSLYEDAGTVPQEATLNGLPCISTAVGGLAETNAGGILLPYVADQWVATIEALDDPTTYARVVERQREALDAYDHDRRLAALAGLVGVLGELGGK